MRCGRGILLLAAAGVVLGAPARADAQQRECTIDAPGRSESTGNQIIVLHDPFTVLCEDGAQLRANSGRLDQAIRELELTGDVYFEDSTRVLTSREATYNSGLGRLWARGDVVFTNRTEGSTLRGPELEYFRATDERPLAQVLATGRPELTIEPEDPDADEAEPLVVVADRFLILGEDDLSAFDSVVVTRSDLLATSAEARYNSTTEDLELRRDAVILYESSTLAGEVVRARLAEGELEHVHARTDARLDSEDMHVEAPDLQLFFAADTLRRAVAVAPPDSTGARALARSDNFELVADSIDAAFVDQKIREVHAVGDARAETSDTTAAAPPAPAVAGAPPTPAETPPTAQDSLAGPPVDSPAPPAGSLPPILAADWVRGDTVIGYFEPVPPDTAAEAAPAAEAGADTVAPEGEVELRRLVAIGSAQSLYRMTPEGEPESTRRNVNFLVGARIELELSGGELSVASVKGLERGVYLEAAADPAEPDAEVTPPLPAPGPAPPTPDLG